MSPPLSEEALAPLEEQEGAKVVATAAPATQITTVTLPDGWTRRITRMRLRSKDAGIRELTLYSGDASNTVRTQLGAAIELTQYQTLVFTTEKLTQMIKKFTAGNGATTGQNVNLYGTISGGTDGIQVDVSYIDEVL